MADKMDNKEQWYVCVAAGLQIGKPERGHAAFDVNVTHGQLLGGRYLRDGLRPGKKQRFTDQGTDSTYQRDNPNAYS